MERGREKGSKREEQREGRRKREREGGRERKLHDRAYMYIFMWHNKLCKLLEYTLPE